ncbi:MAG TPA: hypothetical protein ENJ60_11765 [Aeromonadales bacterium]|nr:hypothetical protein [Aeromonadales bacterium]
MMKTKITQQGLTLVEIMIAVLIGIVLTAGIIQLFISNKSTYRLTESSSRIQESGRFANEFLTKDIRMAGFMGCYSAATSGIENMLNDTGNTGWDISKVIQGYNNVTGGSVAGISNIVDNTDVIIVKSLAGTYLSGGIRLVSPYSDSAQYFVDPLFKNTCQNNDENNCEAKIYVVTDCSKATMFQATNIQESGGKINITHSNAGSYDPGNSSPTPTNEYGEGATLLELATFAYYIRLNNGGRPSLYRSRLNISGGTSIALTAEELVDGVENLQLEYGVDTSGDRIPDSYLNAATINTEAAKAAPAYSWDDVITVKFALLLTAEGRVTDKAAGSKTYNLSTDTPAAGPYADRQLRRVLVNTIGIRNRTL